ncbi:MAG: hypothetical protein OEL89_03965 [Candidatus Peregrinibacteria bacterium]|nr:hypothetical protein [Candidatus Peregrinibacteria bacterium]
MREKPEKPEKREKRDANAAEVSVEVVSGAREVLENNVKKVRGSMRAPGWSGTVDGGEDSQGPESTTQGWGRE